MPMAWVQQSRDNIEISGRCAVWEEGKKEHPEVQDVKICSS